MKRGNLSRVEKYYIEGNTNLPVEDLATELDRSINIVQKHLDTLEKPKKVEKKPKETPKKKQKTETRFEKAIARKERNNVKVSAVMTEAASEIADSTRNRRKSSNKLDSAIHRPKD